jgi:hypothetical protein
MPAIKKTKKLPRRSAKKPWLSLSLSQAFHTRVGKVISLWAFFEDEFNGLLLLLSMNPDARDPHIHMESSFKQRCKLLGTAAEKNFKACPELIERLNKLKTDAIRIKSDRDALAHARWGGDASTGSLQIHRMRKGELVSAAVSLDFLDNLIFEISVICRQVMAIGRTTFPDFSFPLQKSETDALIKFKQEFAKIPAPDPSLINAARLKRTKSK